jgi:peptidyl-prolyl cis-trans isomerase B (cyclophilin B)
LSATGRSGTRTTTVWHEQRLRRCATIGLGRTLLSRPTGGTPSVALNVNTHHPLFWFLARPESAPSFRVTARCDPGKGISVQTCRQGAEGAESMLVPGITRRTGRFAATTVLLIGFAGVAAASASADGAAAAHRLGQSSVQAGIGSLGTPAATTTGRATTADQCGFVPAVPADRFKGIPVFDPVKAAQPYTVVFHTTQGDITVRALTSAAPCTTFSFRYLIDHEYYDRTHCHRLTTQRIYVLQCGDPTGTGSGGPGYSFNDENLTGATYPAGTVAMANAGPNTNGSQFFFTWKDTTLRPNYTPFGVVIRGLDVLKKIAAAGEDDQNNPGDGYPNLYVGFRDVRVHAGR